MARKQQDDDENQGGFGFSPEGSFGADDDEGYELGDEEFDISDAKEHVFQPLLAGTYDAEVIDIEYCLSKASQKPMLKWTFGTTVEGDDGKEHVRKLFMNDSVQQEQFGRVKGHIRAVSPDYDLRHFRPATIGDDLKGSPCRLRLGVKVWNNKKQNEVKEVLPVDSFSGAFLPAGA